MTMPSERTRSVIATKKFLVAISSPYGGGFKRIPREVRDMARRLLRHYPYWFDLGRKDAFDEETAKQLAGTEHEW
jgi:hypothetical protein